MKIGRWLLLIPCGLFFIAQAMPPEVQKVSHTWKSSDGTCAIKVDETIHTHLADGGRGIIRTQESKVTLMSIAADGTTSERWQWIEKPPAGSGYIPLEVADVVIADSHKRFVLLGRSTGLAATGFQRIIVILDDTGAPKVTITADKWWKALGAEGKITDAPPKVQFVGNEQSLEITFESGTIATINTDTGELAVIKRATTAPASSPATSAPSPSHPQ